VNAQRCSLDPVSTRAQVILHENLDLFPMEYRSNAATGSSSGARKETVISID
jgi:hypothetical protein